jgi:hypothetical protein
MDTPSCKERLSRMKSMRCGNTARWETGTEDRSCVQIACNTDLVVFRDESRWFEGALANFWMRALAS